MCGLAGMAGRGFIDEDATVFRELLQLSGMRGIDSTGIYFCDTTGKKLQILERKETLNSLDFVDKYGWSDYTPLYRTDFNLFMGHTRSKTFGGATLANCHPFNLQRYVGAHNGSLTDWEFTFGNGGKTDSELMFEKMDSIGEKGPYEVLNNLAPTSAYAVTIFDKFKRRVIFARNKQRPLWVAINKKRPILYWASEERFLDFVISSNRLDADVFYFSPFKMYTVDINKIQKGDTCPWTIQELTPQETIKKSKEIWYPPQNPVKPLVQQEQEIAKVIHLNATTGETSENGNMILEQLKISGITDYFNSTDHAAERDDIVLEEPVQEVPVEDINWSDAANHQ